MVRKELCRPPVYYQGFAPLDELQRYPRSVAPFVPGMARIEIFRLTP